jgi:hypothetical protein
VSAVVFHLGAARRSRAMTRSIAAASISAGRMPRA